MPLQFLFRSAPEEEAVALFRQQLVAAVWRPSSDEMHAALAAWEAKLVDTLHHWRHPELWTGYARWRVHARARLQLHLAARTHLAAALARLRAAAKRRRRASRQWDRWVVEHEPQHWRPKLDLVRLEQGKAIDHLQLVQTLKTALERQQAAAATRSAPMGGAVETQADRHVRYRAARYSR